MTCHYFKFGVLGWTGHLDGSQWNHPFGVDILERDNSDKMSEEGTQKCPEVLYIINK